MTNKTNTSTAPQLSYKGMHSRLRRNLGLASSRICPCGRPATAWAYIGTLGVEMTQTLPGQKKPFSYSLDYADYQALCGRCHRFVDIYRTKPLPD